MDRWKKLLHAPFQSSNSVLPVVDFWGNLVFFHFFSQFMTFYAFYARKALKKMVFIMHVTI